ncbi:MAG: O-antigen ligase family protein [Clostridiaceae bacterium]|nr:O-antigen ligase family protein [Clostridiaceae bacterium]
MNSKNRSSLKLILLELGLLYLFAGNMLAVYSTVLPYREYLTLIIAIVGFWDLFKFIDLRKIQTEHILTPLLFVAPIIAITTFILYIQRCDFILTIQQVGKALAWIGVFSAAYSCGVADPKALEKLSLYSCTTFIYAYLFLGIKSFSAYKGIPQLSMAYYTLFMVPLALMSKYELVKWGVVGASFFTIVLSFKRAGLIAFILALAVYFIIEYKFSEKESRERRMIILKVLIIISAMVIFLIWYTYMEGPYSVVTKFQSMTEAKGFQRIPIWKTSIKMLRESNSIQCIFGHGCDAVLKNSPIGYSAHTDTIEVLYDYGILGALLLTIFTKRIFQVFRDLCRVYKTAAAPYAAACTISLVIASVSHVIIYPSYFLAICLFWGLAAGAIDSGYYRIIEDKIDNGRYDKT